MQQQLALMVVRGETKVKIPDIFGVGCQNGHSPFIGNKMGDKFKIVCKMEKNWERVQNSDSLELVWNGYYYCHSDLSKGIKSECVYG